jgi:hypothetical protein
MRTGSEHKKVFNLCSLDKSAATAIISAFHFYTAENITDDRPKTLTKNKESHT